MNGLILLLCFTVMQCRSIPGAAGIKNLNGLMKKVDRLVSSLVSGNSKLGPDVGSWLNLSSCPCFNRSVEPTFQQTGAKEGEGETS